MRLVVTREDYFAQALDVLATSGHAALKIASLCKAIGVTTGSFYHYFGSWDGFVEELLAHWEREKTQRFLAVAAAQEDPIERVHLIKDLAVTLPHGAETALRAWAHVNPVVARAQRRVDTERHDALRALMGAVVADPNDADTLAAMGISLLVGVQQWRSPVDADELARVLGAFEALVLSHASALTG